MNKKYSELAELFRSEKTDEEILDFLLNYHKNDIADMMAGMTEEERKRLYHLLGAQKVAEIFKYIEEPRKYIRELSVESAARVISEMDSDDAVDLLEDLDPEEKEQIVRMLDEDAKKDVKMLLSYDEEEIGSCMTTNYICIPENLTIRQAMSELVKQAGENDNIMTIYVVDEKGVFAGAIDLKDLIRARENAHLEDLVLKSYPYVTDHEKIDDCMDRILDYAEDSIPVLSEDKKILGVITSEDLIEMVDNEMGEDYAKLAGLTAEEDLKEPTLQSMKKRLVDLGVYDLNGSEVASTMEKDDITTDLITGFAASPADSQVIGVHHLLKIRDEGDLLYVLVARGMTDDVYMVGKIAVSQIQNLVIAYKERFDRNNFFQNLLLDNLLLVDIYNRAKKLHVEVSCPRAVYLIETKDEKDGIVSEVLKGMFSPQTGDYVTAVDESSLILIKSVESTTTPETLHELAETIVAMMNAEALLDVKVAYGTVVQELKDVSKSYKEAKMALDVGKIFYAEKKVIAYSTLGIGRLIYQLPVNLCKIFIEEIFGDNVPMDLDEETLNTLNKFFENNLNVSETSRQLFVHRNTLVYRIEKIQKSTGLDLRSFDDALTFKIALMVVNYMKYLDNQEY